MTKRIAIIQGHPDPSEERFCRALAAAYAAGAEQGGHEVRTIEVADLRFPWLRGKADFEKGTAPHDIKTCQDIIAKADHLVVIFPLWLGDMPALLKAFFEQTFRPGFAFSGSTERGFPRKLLKGKSARVIITMGMPGVFYRLVYRAHSLKSLRRNILAFCGISPVRDTVIGMVEGGDSARRDKWLATATKLGRKAL